MTDQIDLDAVAAEMARMRQRMAELEGEVARLRPGPPPAPAPSETPPGDGPADRSLDRRAALRKAGLMAAGAVAGGAALAATTASPAAAATVTGSGNPGVSATGLGGDGVSANTNTSGRSGVYATTGTTGAWGVFASHSGGGQALQASASPTSASGKPVAAVNNDGTGMALKATGNPGVAAIATGGGFAVDATSTGSFAARLNGGGLEAIATGTGATGVRLEDYDIGLETDQVVKVNLRLGATTLGSPPARTVAAVRGDVVNDGTDLWCCVTSGTPGVWRKVAGPSTAGALIVLPVPVRVYSSWPGAVPTTVGPKTQMVAGVSRTIDLTLNSSGVPVGATAAVISLTATGSPTGSGSAIVCAAGVTIPADPVTLTFASLNTSSGTTLTALDASARLQVQTTADAHIQVDVIAYHR